MTARRQCVNDSRLLWCAALLASLLLVGCSRNDPGPLPGTWKMDGLIPMTIPFCSGEVEAMGMIEKVSYEVNGSDVIVTYKDGISKGMGIRYTMTGPDTARTELGTLRRIK
jgi:hypothetical protein